MRPANPLPMLYRCRVWACAWHCVLLHCCMPCFSDGCDFAGKEDGRFKDAKVDSLEEKLKKRAELKIIPNK